MKSVIDAFLFQVQERRRAARRQREVGNEGLALHNERAAEAIEDAVVDVFTGPETADGFLFDEDEFRAAALRI